MFDLDVRLFRAAIKNDGLETSKLCKEIAQAIQDKSQVLTEGFDAKFDLAAFKAGLIRLGDNETRIAPQTKKRFEYFNKHKSSPITVAYLLGNKEAIKALENAGASLDDVQMKQLWKISMSLEVDAQSMIVINSIFNKMCDRYHLVLLADQLSLFKKFFGAAHVTLVDKKENKYEISMMRNVHFIMLLIIDPNMALNRLPSARYLFIDDIDEEKTNDEVLRALIFAVWHFDKTQAKLIEELMKLLARICNTFKTLKLLERSVIVPGMKELMTLPKALEHIQCTERFEIACSKLTQKIKEIEQQAAAAKAEVLAEAEEKQRKIIAQQKAQAEEEQRKREEAIKVAKEQQKKEEEERERKAVEEWAIKSEEQLKAKAELQKRAEMEKQKRKKDRGAEKIMPPIKGSPNKFASINSTPNIIKPTRFPLHDSRKNKNYGSSKKTNSVPNSTPELPSSGKLKSSQSMPRLAVNPHCFHNTHSTSKSDGSPKINKGPTLPFASKKAPPQQAYVSSFKALRH